MAWSKAELHECTRYGTLYIVKAVHEKNRYTVVRVGWRKDELHIIGTAFRVGIGGFAQGQIPEVRDLIFVCQTDKSVSLLKSVHLESTPKVKL